MNIVQPRHSPEEFKEWGDRIFEEEIRPGLTPDDHGKFVAIDVEGRGYELSQDERTACEMLRARVPDAQIWLKRVGYRTPHRLGWRGTFGKVEAVRQPANDDAAGLRYPVEEFSRRGNALFEERIAEQVQSAAPLDFVAIDIETGEFEVAPEQIVAISRLRGRSKNANPQIWTRRVGSEIAHRIGGRRRRELS